MKGSNVKFRKTNEVTMEGFVDVFVSANARQEDIATNVRMFPRTMNEAFPGTYEYSCAIERPYPRSKTWLGLAVVCLLAVCVVIVVSATVNNPV